jgi:NitT/TauT family transport system substrate-binding protein
MKRLLLDFCWMNGSVRIAVKRMMLLLVAMTFFLGGNVYVVAQEQLLKVGVSLGDVSLNKLVFMVAYDHGIYKRNGLDVEQFITTGAAEIIRNSGVVVPEKLILKGKGPNLPISIGGCSPMMIRLTTVAGAENPVVLACTDEMVRWHIISRPDISSPEQLKGKRLEYTSYGAVTHLMLIQFARIMGWDPDKDVSLLSGGLKVDGLKKGYTDAFPAEELHETMAVAAGFKDLVDLSKYNMPNAGSSVCVNRAWLKNNEEAGRRFVKATVEALALLKQDKKVAFSSMSRWLGLNDPSLQEYLFKKVVVLPRKPYPPVEGIKKVMEIYDTHEMRKYKPEDFYDASFIRQLDQTGYIDSLYK